MTLFFLQQNEDTKKTPLDIDKKIVREYQKELQEKKEELEKVIQTATEKVKPECPVAEEHKH